MSDETPTRPAGTPDDGGHRRGGAGEQSPLQARAAFFKKRNWQSVADLNGRLCARGGAQHGVNSESGSAAGATWEAGRGVERSLAEALDELRAYHRRALFLFFNGNTFADIARGLAALISRELPAVRLKELSLCSIAATQGWPPANEPPDSTQWGGAFSGKERRPRCPPDHLALQLGFDLG